MYASVAKQYNLVPGTGLMVVMPGAQ